MSRDLAQLKGVRLSLGGAPLFDGVDLALVRGERAALVGDNGAGKSTLLAILSGKLEADAGARTIANGVTMAVAPQEPDLAGAPTLRDYVMAGAHPVPAHRADAELSAWGLDPARDAKGLSGGETRRAALARAFAAEADILLLDEPTNHLDIPAIEQLETRLRAQSGAVLTISHDRRFLEEISTVCYWLRNRRVLRLDRGYGAFEAWAEEVESADARAFATLEKHLAAEEYWLRRGVTARRSRNEGRRRKLEQLRSERRASKADLSRTSAALEAGRSSDSGRLVIEAKGISRTVAGADGPRPLIRDLSLRIMRGDRVGFVGPNGAGKTTLLDILLKRADPDAGTVRHGAGLEIAYADQTRSTLDPATSVRDTLCPLGGDQVMVRGRPQHVAAYAKTFLFGPEHLRQPTGALSGGERNRLTLAVTLARPSNVLVLDEPTNDLDLDTLSSLEDMLAAYDGTVLIVSHDRAFLDGVVTQVVGAVGDGRWAETPGGYRDFEREHGGFRLASPRADTRAAPRETAREAPAPQERAPRKLSYKDERALAMLEARLPQLEAEIAALEARLADPALFDRDPQGFSHAAQRLEAARNERDAAETQWLEIEERRSSLTG